MIMRYINSHLHLHLHRLTRQYGGEQSGLVTLTFYLLTLKAVSESSRMCNVGYLYADFGLPGPLFST